MSRWKPFAFASLVALGARYWIARRRRMSAKGASVVITGGSRGLGLVMARQLAARGAKLTLLARNRYDLGRARQQILEGGPADVLVIPCDVGDAARVRAAMREAIRHHGRIDAVINNAGTMEVGPLEHMSVVDFERAMNVHFRGAVNTTLAVIPHFAQRGGGRIVNIASVGGLVAVPHMAPYCASKFALVGFSDATRTELAELGILVTTVAPGLMRTGSHVNALFRGRHRAEYAWFSAGAAAPLLSMSAERAATRIIDAMLAGRRALTLGWSARLAALLNAAAPAVVGELLAGVERLLPGPATHDGARRHTGWDSQSPRLPAFLTHRADRHIDANNERRGHFRVPWEIES